MTELTNAFVLTTIRSGHNTKPLNVLQVQRLLESNIEDCEVIGVIPRNTCTLLRLAVKGQVFDFAIASNTVACRTPAGNSSTDYTGVLVESVLAVISSFLDEDSTSTTATETITATDSIEAKMSVLIKEVISENPIYAGFDEITNRKFWKDFSREIFQTLPNNATNTQIKDAIRTLMNRRLARI